MKNNEYWRKRYEEMQLLLLDRGDRYLEELEKQYNIAFTAMETDIQAFYQRFANNENLTYAEAVKVLTSKERKAFQMTLEEYIKKGQENGISADWAKELESASNIYHIDRLKTLQFQLRQQIELIEASKLKALEEIFTQTYAESYYRSIFELQKGLGQGNAFSILDVNRVEKALSMTFDSTGLNFSEKIWKDRNYLARTLETEFPQMIIRGKGPDDLINLLSQRFNTSKSAAANLVQTESAFLASLGREESYKELDVEEFEISSTLDLKVCDVCRDMDGQHFPMSERKIGINAPHFHNYCRCVDVPYFPDDVGERAARNPETGKTYYVQSDMKYHDWYDTYVKGNPKAELEEKKIKNLSSDKNQYARYKDMLGKNAPKSFDIFQDLKYNNSNGWDSLKQAYRDQPIRNKIKSDEQIKDIHDGRQGKHILGHNNYIPGRSYLTVTTDEAQELVNKYAGTGIIERDKKGIFRDRELITVNKDIGVNINESTKLETTTNRFYIHYSNKGTHIVPTLKEGDK